MNKNNMSLTTLGALYFFMGLITVLNDILIPHLKELFQLTYFQAALVQFCFFGVYFITGSFWGKVISKIGYPNGVSSGFLIAALGCLLFLITPFYKSYFVFLGALFILASGIVLLQASGNPFVTLLSPNKEARNLTLVQAFGSAGTMIGPLIGAYFILDQQNYGFGNPVVLPYFLIAIFLIILALVVYFLKLPDVRQDTPAPKTQDALRSDLAINKTSIW